jgi:ATP-dependent Lon protease
MTDLDEATSAPATETPAMLVRADELLPEKIHLIPLAARPFFPAQTMPVIVPEGPWRETLQRVGSTPHHIMGLVYTGTDPERVPAPAEFRAVGTAVRVHHAARGEGKLQFVAEGLKRFRVVRWLSQEPPYLVQVEYLEPPREATDDVRAYALAIINIIKDLLPLNPLYKEPLRAFLDRFQPDEAGPLTDFAAALTSASALELQEVLEIVPLVRRMERVLTLLQKELEVAGLQAQIRKAVEEKVSEHQRQFFLREQMKEIQKELGISKDDKTVEVERLRARIAELDLPPHAARRIEEEMQKLSFLETGSPEYSVTRNYLDALTALPWGKYSADTFDLAHARAILDRDHDALEDVKERIVEFLAVGAYKREIAGSILLLVGPPGVGKSSIGRSIAEALGRRFYRFSLGGMRDEAEIKGHRRTYIGAMPGKFVQAMREAGTANPVIMLDEVDKVGASYHGDPASALLEVLDPALNADFLDHYLDVRFDLSKVLFICTANQIDTIPPPLLDRMEQIRLAGYLTAEKVAIARRHLWPRLLERAGVKDAQIGISAGALTRVIEDYARESGVRNLEKQLGRIVRKSVVKLLAQPKRRLRIGAGNLKEYLGPALFRAERPATGVGVVTGLAWTALGGATLDVEAAVAHHGKRGLKLTGKLGEVMRESAEIAYSYVGGQLAAFGARGDFLDQAQIHLHVPEGATPKDGPSAGITMATALVSLARKTRIGRPLAMTGELTLTGRVLPVGGIREKVLAARRNRLSEIIVPAANERDFNELPAHLRDGLKVHFARHFRDVFAVVFGLRRRPARRRRAGRKSAIAPA